MKKKNNEERWENIFFVLFVGGEAKTGRKINIIFFGRDRRYLVWRKKEKYVKWALKSSNRLHHIYTPYSPSCKQNTYNFKTKCTFHICILCLHKIPQILAKTQRMRWYRFDERALNNQMENDTNRKCKRQIMNKSVKNKW